MSSFHDDVYLHMPRTVNALVTVSSSGSRNTGTCVELLGLPTHIEEEEKRLMGNSRVTFIELTNVTNLEEEQEKQRSG